MRRPTRSTTIALAVGGAVLASATAGAAAALQPDGVHLRSQWTNGGHAWLKLEDRNVEPVICFIWENDRPQDGDSIASRVLTVGGAEVVDLGTGDQWIDGAAEGCEIPRDGRYRDVLAHPDRYIVEFRVVEEQGTQATAPVRSRPLESASG